MGGIGLSITLGVLRPGVYGSAEPPRPTAKVERLGRYDRQQLAANVTLQTYFKGTTRRQADQVLGNSFTPDDTGGAGIGLYVGPVHRFVSPGAQPVVLAPDQFAFGLEGDACRFTNVRFRWRTCRRTSLDASENSIRDALGQKVMGVIRQGRVRGERYSAMPALNQPEAVANMYGRYVSGCMGKLEPCVSLSVC